MIGGKLTVGTIIGVSLELETSLVARRWAKNVATTMFLYTAMILTPGKYRKLVHWKRHYLALFLIDMIQNNCNCYKGYSKDQ